MSDIARGKLFNVIMYCRHVEFNEKRTKEFVHFHHNESFCGKSRVIYSFTRDMTGLCDFML